MDYMGETDLGWPDVSSHYGLFDIAGFPKDTAGLYRAWWQLDPAAGCSGTISLSPTDWTAPVAPGHAVTVYAFTCAPRAELFVDGASQGAQDVPPLGAVQWAVGAFAPGGNITARALDASGAVLGSASVAASGAAVRLRAWLEAGYLPPRNASVLAAAGGDVALIGVEVLDAAGVRVAAGAPVVVTLDVAGPGEVYGLHNGAQGGAAGARAAPCRAQSPPSPPTPRCTHTPPPRPSRCFWQAPPLTTAPQRAPIRGPRFTRCCAASSPPRAGRALSL